MITALANTSRVRIDELISRLDALEGSLTLNHKHLVDELQALSVEHDDANAKAIVLFFSALIKKNTGEINESLILFKEARKSFEKLGLHDRVVQTINLNGWIIGYLQSKYAEGLAYIQKAFALAEQIDYKKGICNSLNNIGTIFYVQGNYTHAMDYFLRSLKIAEEIGNTRLATIAMGNIGNLYDGLKDYPLALEYQKKALELAEEGRSNFISNTLSNIGITYFSMGDYNNAFTYQQRAIKIRYETGDKRGIVICLNNLAKIFIKESKLITAKNYLQKSLELAEELGSKSLIVEAKILMGSVLARSDQFDEAELYLKETLTMAEELGALPPRIAITEELYNYYKVNNDYNQALHYHEQMIDLKEQISNEETHRKIAGMQLATEIEQKEKDAEIERLKNVELKKANELIALEKIKSEKLLLNILPAEVADELKEKGSTNARYFENVTVMFTDFKEFTKLSEKFSPQELVDELHACFMAFDIIIEKYDLEKIKTIGDAYMAVSGLPVSSSDHAVKMVSAAKEILQFIKERKAEKGDNAFEIRIGIHSGNVVAGVVGVKKFAYDIWGDTVNIAARMEQNCEPGQINISAATYELIKNDFSCRQRGKIDVKNKGFVEMFYVTDRSVA